MFAYQLALDEPIAGPLVQELARRVYFVSDDITGFRLLSAVGGVEVAADRGAVGAVEAVTARPVDEADLARKLRLMVKDEVRAQIPQEEQVLWRSAAGPPVADHHTYDALLSAGIAHEVAPGEVALTEPALGLLDTLDALLTKIAVETLGARPYRYPTLLPVEALERTGYFTSFPQHVMFAARLHGDLDTYRAFVDEVRAAGGRSGDVLSRCAPVRRCLPPTMCYHTFHQLAGSSLPTAEGVAYTARGRAFRNESRYQKSMERLADFTIREIVFVGPDGYVRAARDAFVEAARRLVDRLGLVGRSVAANDPFFAGADGAARGTWQRMMNLKQELQLDIAPGKSIAVGSFNRHDQGFGEAFDIRAPDGTPAHSSCVGFGLERLTYAVLCQYGTDTADWPEPLRP